MSQPTFTIEPIDGAEGARELALRGRIYADVAPDLKRELLRHVESEGLKSLVVNAKELEQIDSSGLNVFVQVLKLIRPGGGKIVFYGLNENIRRVFDITKLTTVMAVTQTRADAVAAVAVGSGA